MGSCIQIAAHRDFEPDAAIKTSSFVEIYKGGISGYISSGDGALFIKNETLFFRQPSYCTVLFNKLRHYSLQDITSVEILDSTLRCDGDFKLDAPILKICTLDAVLLASEEYRHSTSNGIQDFAERLKENLQRNDSSYSPPNYDEASSLLSTTLHY